MLNLNTVFKSLKIKKLKKRLGRGIGSGLGKTCGRGHKGQKSRSGKIGKIFFEGGQTSFYRRLPKWGFNFVKNNIVSLNLSNLIKFPFTVVSFKFINYFLNLNLNFLKIFVKIFSKKNIKRKFIFFNIIYSKFLYFFFNNLKFFFVI